MRKSALVILVPFVLCTAPEIFAQTPILTHHYDNARTGQNTNETILTPANVSSGAFGKLFALTADGYVYAQPLYVPNLAIPSNGTHNVIFIATEHDSVYAYDADNGALLWFRTFLSSGVTTLSPSDVGNTQDIHPEMGITGTPVIDPAMTTMYVVVNTKESAGLIYRLHALDITTGLDKLTPVMLTGSVPGTAPDGANGIVPFNPQWANQRPGLLLYNGFLYIGFASHGDNGPWHGWILGYNAATLAQTGAYCASPNGTGSGFWMSGGGLAADQLNPTTQPYGRMFVPTGNGDYNATKPYANSMDYGDS